MSELVYEPVSAVETETPVEFVPKRRRRAKLQEVETQTEKVFRVSLPLHKITADGKLLEHLDITAPDRDTAIDLFKERCGILDSEHRFKVVKIDGDN